MLSKFLKTLDPRNREQWRNWLAKHHESNSEVWLVFHKRHTGRSFIAYDDAVDEALCFGWIDSLIKRLDDDRYARKFTPRKPGSVISAHVHRLDRLRQATRNEDAAAAGGHRSARGG